jgi:signal transduction histidine kinase
LQRRFRDRRVAASCSDSRAALNLVRDIDPRSLEGGAHRHRTALIPVVFAVALALVIADFMTWIELDVAAIFGLPLVMAGATRSRLLLWSLTGLLVMTTFVVYALQIPPGAFAINEVFFVNRLLNAASLLLLAGLLHVWMRSVEIGEAQARLIEEQNGKLQAATVSRRIVEVQEAERREVANHLHDLVGQKLTALSINLNIVKSHLPPGQAAQCDVRLDESLKLVEETTDSIRDVMAALRPAVLDDFGLAAVLRWYADQFTRRTGVATSVVEQGPSRRLPSTIEYALFRMAQNALGNAAKHARAEAATVTLRTTARSVCLTVSDDGVGFDPAAVQQPARDHGWGLMIMRERAAAIGAQLSIESSPGRGTRVVVTVNGDTHDQGRAGG